MLTRFALNTNLSKFFFSQTKATKYRYLFQTGVSTQIHPLRNIDMGFERHSIQDNIILLADGGTVQGIQNPQPQNFAYSLVKYLELASKHEKYKFLQNPVQFIDEAIEQIQFFGLSTITICTLHPQTGLLKFFYVGTSIYGVFKKDDIQMVGQQVFDLGRSYAVGKRGMKSKVGYLEQMEYGSLSKDDVIVIGSDGLWDNLDISIIHYETRGPGSLKPKTKQNINYLQKEDQDVQEKEMKTLPQIANRICGMAYTSSFAYPYESPFYFKAQKFKKEYPQRGKVDDVTVILAKIVKEKVQDF